MGKPGRPKGSDNKEKICSLRLDEQTLKRLNAYCERLKVAKSEVIRVAIERILEEDQYK